VFCWTQMSLVEVDYTIFDSAQKIHPILWFEICSRIRCQPRRMGAPNGAPVAPPSTISSTALTYEESSEARKSTALASSSGSPQRPNGITEEKNFVSLADSSADIEARSPRFQIGVFVAPGATTFTRMLRGARSAAMARAIETRPPFVAAYAA